MQGSLFVDCYRVLGVSPDATADEIRSAYRRMALLVHPDRNKNDPNASKNMAAVNQAWEILSDEVKRAEFDQMRTIFYSELHEQIAHEAEQKRQQEEAYFRYWNAEQERLRHEENARYNADRKYHSNQSTYSHHVESNGNVDYTNSNRTQKKKISKRISWSWWGTIIGLSVVGLLWIASYYGSSNYPDQPQHISFDESPDGEYVEIRWDVIKEATYYRIYTCLSQTQSGCMDNSDHVFQRELHGNRYRQNINEFGIGWISAIVIACNAEGCPPNSGLD